MKRYDYLREHDSAYVHLEESHEGQFVKYSDADAELSRLRDELAEARAELLAAAKTIGDRTMDAVAAQARCKVLEADNKALVTELLSRRKRQAIIKSEVKPCGCKGRPFAEDSDAGVDVILAVFATDASGALSRAEGKEGT